MRLTPLALIVSLLAASAASAAEAVWTIAIAGRRDVVLPMRVGPDGMPSADARLLGPDLELSVAADQGRVTIRDASGLTWETAHGSTHIDGPIESRSLSVPVHVAQQAVFLPLDAIARLAGRRLVLEERGRAFLMPETPPPPTGNAATGAASAPAARTTGASFAAAPGASAGALHAPSGWQLFQLPKTAEEREAAARDDGDLLVLREKPRTRDIQPDAHDTLGLDVGLGYAQNGGAALDASGSGSVAGFRVSLSGFLTARADQFTYRSGRVAVESPANAWTIEAGDLLSEARGLGRGLRVSRRIGSRWRPGVSIYADDSRLPNDRAALSYRDSILLHRNLDVRGEASTDGSLFVATRLLAGRGSVETFYRYTAWRDTADRGVSLSYSLWRGISAYGGLRLSAGDARDRWNMIGLSVPLVGASSLSLEQARNTRGSVSDTNHALGLQLPLGNVRIVQRFQWTDVALLDGPSVFDAGRRQLQSMASYAPSPRLRFTYQLATQWFSGSEARQWTELETVFRASARTSFHAVTGLPQFNSPQRLRVGFQQQLPRAFRLSVDYGRLPAFENSIRTAANDPRLLVMVRRSVRVQTPPGGADVTGTVRDDSGAPVNGAVVALGRFRTTTREDGSYRFAHVPPGAHTLELVTADLPAAYANASDPIGVTVVTHKPVRADLHVTALRAVHGRVRWAGRARNGIDEQESLAGIVVRLDEDGPATLTDEEGAFHFYNLQPGPYTVWIDAGRLRRDLQAVPPLRRRITLDPERASSNVELLVSPHEKPILMKELP